MFFLFVNHIYKLPMKSYTFIRILLVDVLKD